MNGTQLATCGEGEDGKLRVNVGVGLVGERLRGLCGSGHLGCGGVGSGLLISVCHAYGGNDENHREQNGDCRDIDGTVFFEVFNDFFFIEHNNIPF